MVGYYKCDLGTRHCVHLDDMHRIDEINSLVTCQRMTYITKDVFCVNVVNSEIKE